MRRSFTYVAVLALLLLALGSTALEQPVTPILTSGTALPQFPPVPPPSEAAPISVQVAPLMSWGSPYLHVTVRSYSVALSADAIEAYYAPRLEALRYTWAGGPSEACGPQGCYAYFWAFQRGQGELLVLTVRPHGASSRYSLARDLIVLPSRPWDSFVPPGATSVVLRAQPLSNGAPTSRTFTDPATVNSLVRIVNGLSVDPMSGHGCNLSPWSSAQVTFISRDWTYRFYEIPACGTVAGPGGAALTDLPNDSLWDAVVRLLRLRHPFGA